MVAAAPLPEGGHAQSWLAALEPLADQVVGDCYPPLAARKRMLTGTASAMPEAVGR